MSILVIVSLLTCGRRMQPMLLICWVHVLTIIRQLGLTGSLRVNPKWRHIGSLRVEL